MIHLKIYELRKQKGISQQVLAEALGVSFQTVSKWENNTTMPDITLLPDIAGYFDVSVDQLLGLAPLSGEVYIPVQSGSREYWNERLDYLIRTRKYMWNQDYMEFLVEKVWKITRPVDVLDCGCGWGFLASFLLPLLPKGSTYTGIDVSETLTEEGRRMNPNDYIRFICEDFMKYRPDREYDIVIAQAVLRHIGNPEGFLKRMMNACKKGGTVICIDVNREVEHVGLYIEGMDYSYLCSKPGFHKMWQTELDNGDRDYAVGIRLPKLLTQAGLKAVECRMNDKVNFITPEKENYRLALQDLMETREWSLKSRIDEQAVIHSFMNHGMTKAQAQEYCLKQRKIKDFLNENQENLSIAVTGGLMIAYGKK